MSSTSVALLARSNDEDWPMWKRRKTHPFLKAIRAGDLTEVARLAASGLDLNQEYPKSSGNTLTPLCQATISEQPKVAEWLLSHGAQVATVMELDFMLVWIAARARAVNLLQYLLTHGIKVRAGSRTMYEAAFSQSIEVFELLIEHGGDVRELETADPGMLGRIHGDILRRAIADGAQFPLEIVEMALSYMALGDKGVPPDSYRR